MDSSGPDREQVLKRLVDLSLQVAHEGAVERVFETVAVAILDLLQADRAFVILADGKVAARAYAPGQSGEPSSTIAQYTLHEGIEMVTADISEEDIAPSQSMMARKLRAVLCVPMSDGADVGGALYADSMKRGHKALKEDIWLARAFAAQAMVAAGNARAIQAEEQRARQAREALHDVKNQLGSMRFALEELSEEPLEGWIMMLVGQMRAQVDSSLATMTSALHEKRPAAESVRLEQLVGRTAALMQHDARRAGVHLKTSLTPVGALAVPSEISRVVANLVGNAVKYSPNPGVVHLTTQAFDDHALISVRDEGPGIPPEELQSVFDSGRQGRGALEGFGLGLGICARLVKANQGVIVAANASPGALFEVRLPRT